MKIYKEKQFLIFDFEDGKTVKYDFATKKAIGKRGKPVKNLNSQLEELSVTQMIACCSDSNYAEFLKFIRESERHYISNIGTILQRIPKYARFEQIFSAGYQELIKHPLFRFRYSATEIPKGLIKICKEYNVKISNELVASYIKDPNKFHVALNVKFENLNVSSILDLLQQKVSVKVYYGAERWNYDYVSVEAVNSLLQDYGYNFKSLIKYIDDLYTYEAMDTPSHTLRELYDYVSMMSQISNKFDKYPKHFLTTHKIACRNYSRLKQKFNEQAFKERINQSYEYNYKDYSFIYPKSIQEIKDEATAQSNCVASYIDRVIAGDCHIMFLRKKKTPSESLVTLEIKNNQIIQAKRKFNYSVTQEDQEAIDAWNKKYNMEVLL